LFRLKKLFKHLLTIFFGVFLAFILLEIILRIWHPFQYTVKGDKIILAANIRVKMKNKWIKKLDDTIYYSRNAIGLRGEEWPADPRKFITIITVGGSTTECKFLSDSCTWPEKLRSRLNLRIGNIWLNNAGLDGHSTFGHLILMSDYIVKLHPKYVLFLVGTNDVELEKSADLDDQDIKGIHTHSIKYLFKSLFNYSEVGSLLVSLYRNHLAYKKGLVHKEKDPGQLKTGATDSISRSEKIALQQKFLINYSLRLNKLASISKNNGIVPVFITQPALYGDVTDSTTNIFLGNLKLDDFDCSTDWQVLQLYNEQIRKLRYQGIAVIDLASAMPKDSKYFYDFMHYTNAGADKVAGILTDSLIRILK
jgi:hypothetical protein